MINDYREFVHQWIWLIGCVSVVFLYLINWYRRPKKSPPGPRGLPILGYLPFLRKNPAKAAYKLSKKYGPIVNIRTGGNDTIFLNDYNSIHKAFVKQGGTLSGRRPFPELAALDHANGIVSLDYGEKLKEQRKFGLMTLRGFGLGKKGMENICVEELNYLVEEILRKEEKPFDISTHIHNAISNNICSVVLGQRFDYDDKHFKKMLHVVIDSFDDPTLNICNQLISFAPMLKYVPPISIYNGRFVQSVKDVLDWLNNLVVQHEKTFDANQLRDFIDAFLLEKQNGKKDFTSTQLLHYINDLFVAGTETSSSTLYWSVLCFLHFPETQKKLRKEILQVLGSSGTVSMSKKADMPYTNAFIQEIYRYRTLAPLGVPHKANAATEIDGWVIPKDSMVLANIWAVHNDSTVWKNPDRFIPERFLDKEGKFFNHNNVIPFSVGPRHCLGEQLARMEVFIFLVGLVQKFEFLPDPDVNELPTLEGTLGLAYVPKPFKIVAKPL